MAACRIVNVNMLRQQTLNQPLVTASWNDLKTCVTLWPNLGWCSMSLTRTKARTALMTSDFHYKPAVDPNVHLGWDGEYNGSAALFGQECACSLGAHWAVKFSRCSLLTWHWKAVTVCSFSPLLMTISYVRAVCASNCCDFPLLSSSHQGTEWCDAVGCSLWVITSAQTLRYSVCHAYSSRFESLVCMWPEMYDLKSLAVAQVPVWPNVTSRWVGPGRDVMALRWH